MSLEPGSRLGPYDVLAPLGAGGMGEVWRARDSRLGREVALKVLPEAFASDRERISRFQREAQLLAAFNHTNIAAIYSFENVEGVQLLVMEMVPGETVRELIAAGPLGLTRALGIARQVADALDAAHGKGILHRDLKPANVKVTPEGKVKLLDFGLAKAFAPGPIPSDISESPTLDTGATRQGMVLGTASYMSPEQARGKPLDWRSDVWSFGCLLYEMLAGQKAFQGESPSDVLVAILDKDPDWTALPLDMPPRILDVVKGCLTKSRDERTPDMAHARQVIDAVLEGRTTVVPSTGPSARIRRFPQAYAAAGSILAVVVAGLLYVSLRGKDGKALPATKLLAILPATDLTGRENGRQFCDGVSASLRAKLHHASGVQIMLPSDAAAARETDPAKAARDEGANLILQPSVRQVGNRLQILYFLRLASSPEQIDSDEVTGPEGDVFNLENELVKKIAASLDTRFAGGGAAPHGGIPPGPSQSDYFVALGYLERYDDPAQVQNAIDLLTKIPKGEDSAVVQAALGRACLAAYNLSKDVQLADLARRATERAVAMDPNLPEAQVTLGQILTATGSPEKAVEVIKKALEKQPESPEAAFALAYALELSRNAVEAEKAYLRGTEIRPTAWYGFNKLGGFYAASGRFEEAVAAFRRAIVLNPESGRPHYNLGAVLLRLGRPGEAEKELRRALEIRKSTGAYSNLGTCQYLLGRYEDAAASFDEAIRLAPDDFHLRIYLGDALTHVSGRGSDAREAYEAALPLGEAELRINPADAPTRALVARALARLGRSDRAWKEVQLAVASAPDGPDALLPAAGVAAILDHVPEALEWLRRAVRKGVGPFEMEHDPDFERLRADPAFQALLGTPAARSTPLRKKGGDP